MQLNVYGKEPHSVFGVFGDKENTATFAVGWVLTRSPAFLEGFLDALGVDFDPSMQLSVDLQRHSQDGGFTDIELRQPNGFHVIVEAKRGWALPSQEQLARYAPRFDTQTKGRNILVSISAASQDYSKRLLASLRDAEVCHLPWSDIRRLAIGAYKTTRSLEEKLWLRELATHLGDYVSIQDPNDNRVYVVSLSGSPILSGSEYSWIDVVERESCYFHPFGTAGWPVVPPNYLGFRYHGQLQSVHHVSSFRIVPDLAKVDARWPTTDLDHFVYQLGPPMRPSKVLPTGAIFRSGRVWCAIDTLLSGEFPTISAARDETKRRLSAAGA